MRELIGAIVRLQVQRSSLKIGGKPHEHYDPVALVAVSALEVTPDGATGIAANGERILDVHNNAHPQSKSRRTNTLSAGFTAHYDRMRERFGTYLTDGIAGENLLVTTTAVWSLDDLAHGLVIVTANDEIALGGVMVAEPCNPFTRFALRYPADAPATREITDALQFLRAGTRGFYVTYTGAPVSIAVGDQLYRQR